MRPCSVARVLKRYSMLNCLAVDRVEGASSYVRSPTRDRIDERVSSVRCVWRGDKAFAADLDDLGKQGAMPFHKIRILSLPSSFSRCVLELHRRYGDNACMLYINVIHVVSDTAPGTRVPLPQGQRLIQSR